ncbi:unnamed protein product [Arctia plantaginis]|uniref:Uncharacterized protein n=1 Tax=Arctia plantaginis TaxID=874455 RepID=A0A8S1AHN7_ARCPL|nr:unnamed protein product [Arctia plantaginis]
MDASYIFLTLLLLIQMALILTMLNPVYDVRKITSCINNLTKSYRSVLMAKRSAPLVVQTRATSLYSSENLPLSFLRVKRSMSYETVLFTNELREQLKNILKSFEYLHDDTPMLSSVLEASSKI